MRSRRCVGVESRVVIYPGGEPREARPDVAILPGEPRAPMPVGPAAIPGAEGGVAVLEVAPPLDPEFEARETYLEIREARAHELVAAPEVLSPANKQRRILMRPIRPRR